MILRRTASSAISNMVSREVFAINFEASSVYFKFGHWSPNMQPFLQASAQLISMVVRLLPVLFHAGPRLIWWGFSKINALTRFSPSKIVTTLTQYPGGESWRVSLYAQESLRRLFL